MQLIEKYFETALQKKAESCRLFKADLVDGQAVCRSKCYRCGETKLTFLLRNKIDPAQELWKCEKRWKDLIKAVRKDSN